MRNKSIAFKLIFLVCTTSALIFLLVFGLFHHFASRLQWQDTERYVQYLTEDTAHRVEAILGPIQKIPEGLAVCVEQARLDQGAMLRMLKASILANPDIYGCWIAFEPYGFDKKSLYYQPYCYRDHGQVKLKWLGSPAYRYFYMDYYQLAKELGRPVWCKPYFDVGGGDILMASYSVPFYRTVGGRREFAGVAGVDISMRWLTRQVSAIKVLKTGDAFLITKDGTYVTHHHPQLIMNETIFSVAEGRGDQALRAIGRRMIRGETGFAPIRRIFTGEAGHIFFAPIHGAGWSLGVVFPDRELLAGLRRLSWITVLAGAGAMLLLVFFLSSECRSVAQPLSAMARAAETMAAGDLDVSLPPARSRDEVGRLTDSFLRMRDSLKKYIKDLTETTAAKQRIESELNIAREIQDSLLPKIFPPLPAQPELEMFAVLQPAREVGGDLYDFYMLGENKFCFVIGDVSGKGVPASLFMAITKTLLKSTAAATREPAEILSRVNEALSEGNEKAMFVTTFLAVLDLKTGELTYSNGGHNPPLVVRKSGELSFLGGGKGLAVGVLPEARYAQDRIVLEPGDRLFLYTDGVTEAMTPDGEFFTEDRMLAGLRAVWDQPPKETVLGLLKDVEAFAKGEHADDITMMSLKYIGPAA